MQCCVGDRLSVKVGGDFIYSPASLPSCDLLLVGGGVGINPLLSMLQHHAQLRKDGGKKKTTLLYSAKSLKELLFKVSYHHSSGMVIDGGKGGLMSNLERMFLS